MISLCILLIAMGVAEALPVSDDNVPSSPVAAVEDSTPAPSASAAVEQGKGSKPNLYIFLGVIIPIVSKIEEKIRSGKERSMLTTLRR